MTMLCYNFIYSLRNIHIFIHSPIRLNRPMWNWLFDSYFLSFYKANERIKNPNAYFRHKNAGINILITT